MGRVVVGVDGSQAGQAALAFAADEARMRAAVLEVVHVRGVAGGHRDRMTRSSQTEFASAGAFQGLVEQERAEDEEIEERARQAAETLLRRAVDDVDVTGVDVERTSLVDRRRARRLVELANGRADTELLVVGSRGLGELSGMLLGSISQACVTHARVPVTVVHQRDG